MVMEFGHFELVVCLAVCLPLSGLSLADVLVDPQTQGVLGRPVTLPCRFVGAGQVIQVTWLKLTELGPQMVAARSLEHGTSTHPFYGARAHFLAPSSDPDASLVIREAALTDGGTFRCAIVTFPAGNFEKDTRLTVLVPPQASVVPGPRALLEGDRDALAATCTATGSSPPATVRWESAVPGAQEEVASHNANGTVTISSSFYLDPVRAMQGHRLSCLVNHSTFSRPTRLEHTLNIYYVPEVTVSKSSENWHVGMDNAELTCQENGNPPASGFVWRRLDGSLPNNSVTEGNRLLFQSSLSADDAGTYICEAKNTIGSRTGQTDIKIIDADVPSVNMLSMAFVAIGAVGVLLLLILVVSIIAVNRYHKNKTEQMVFKLEEISTMSRQPSIRRCNSMSASVDARLQDGGGSRENVLEQEPMLQEALAQQAQQLRNSTRELRPVNGEGTLPPSAFGNHRYSLRSTTSEMTQAPPAYQFGAFRYSLNSSLRPIGRDRMVGPGSRTLPPPIPLNNHRDSTTEMVETPEQMEILSRRTLTPSPSVLDSQTEDEDEVTDRQQSIQAAMGHFYSHNGTLRAKPTGNGIYIARREHCV